MHFAYLDIFALPSAWRYSAFRINHPGDGSGEGVDSLGRTVLEGGWIVVCRDYASKTKQITDFADLACLKIIGSYFVEVSEAPQARSTASKNLDIKNAYKHIKNAYKHIPNAYKYINILRGGWDDSVGRQSIP